MYIIKQMNKDNLPKFLITTIIMLCVTCSSATLFAQKAMLGPSFRESSDQLQLQAREYRELGLERQRIGNLTEAMSLYQKAIAIDSGYAVAYNDLGVLYEAMGYSERAEESYLKALRIDSGYPSAYTNLALLYESQRNLEKAAFYWDKRVKIGSADDPWTQKAANRLRDIRLVLSKQPISDLREEEVLGLIKDVGVNKSMPNGNDNKVLAPTKDVALDKSAPNEDDNKVLARNHFKKAQESFKRGDLPTAIQEALDAQNLDQDNSEIEAFIEKTQLRALSR